MSRALSLIGLTCVALVGCGNDDLQQRTELQEYRVLAIRSDIPEPGPEETVILSVVEHDPHDVDPEAPLGAPFYVWEVCPFSFGSLAQYDCFDPLAQLQGDMAGGTPTAEQQQAAGRVIAVLAEKGITPDQAAGIFSPTISETERAELILDMETVGGVGIRTIYELCAAVSSDGVCRTLDGNVVTLEAGWNLYVKLYSGREGVVRNDTVKVLKVRDFDGRNRNNPAFATLETTDLEGQPATQGVPGQTLTFTLTLVAGSAEEYPEIQYDDQGAMIRNADGTPVTETATEELLYSWYATGGDFKRSRTVTDSLFDQRENNLKLPEEAGPVRVWVVARDGRGGFAARSLDIQVVEAP